VGAVERDLAITARRLTKHFGTVVAIDGLDLEVPRGGVFGLLGRSGAGTTTALRLLAGRLRPTSGTATVAGVPVEFDSIGLRRRIGVLDQEPAFHGWMTGRELLALAADLGGLPRAEVRSRVDETLDRVGLADVGNERVAGYTRSRLGRLGIGQAIVASPEVLLLDDPLARLDADARRDLIALLRSLHSGVTVVVSAQDPADAEAVCDRGVILDHGRLVPAWR
jgi:ABC-2 type transport system ATP-binding protein